MKLLLTILCSSFIIMTTNIAQAIEISIKVTNINIDLGRNMTVFLFGKVGFPKVHKKALASQTKPANKATLDFKFSIDRDDNIAIKVHHDENRDGKVTKNWTRIWPKEGLGFSNGQKLTLTGPPSFKKAKLNKKQLKEELKSAVRYPREAS